MRRKTYVGKCVECGASLYCNEQEERLEAKGGTPGCLHHYDIDEEEKDGETRESEKIL